MNNKDINKNGTAANPPPTSMPAKISDLSGPELLSRFGRLVQTERKITHRVLEYIAEIDSRRLFLEKAYPSLYEFLVREYGYSSSAALRRIESARLLREVPEVADQIESGALNLSQLSKVSQAVRAAQKLENRKLETSEKKELLKRIEYSTQAQTEVILSEVLSLHLITEEKEKSHRDESVTLTITFTKEQMQILKKAQDLIAHAVPEKKWAEAITYLAEKEVKRRTKSPERTPVKIPEKKFGVVRNTIAEDFLPANTDSTTGTNPKPHARTPVAGAVRKLILSRQRCCQYRDPKNKKLCGSTRFLQIDHRQPVWAGGGNEPTNLQILCSAHNQYKYRQESGLR